MGERETTSIMCPDCEGTGFTVAPGDIQEHCGLCDGTGTYDEPHPTPPSDDLVPVDLDALQSIIRRWTACGHFIDSKNIEITIDELRHRRAQAVTWEREKKELVDGLTNCFGWLNMSILDPDATSCDEYDVCAKRFDALLKKHTPVEQEGE